MKVCRHCNQTYADDLQFCVQCGNPLEPTGNAAPYTPPVMQQPVYTAPSSAPGHELALIGLILSAIGIPIVGLILCLLARKDGNREGICTAGIVLSIISLVSALIIVVLYFGVIIVAVLMESGMI